MLYADLPCRKGKFTGTTPAVNAVNLCAPAETVSITPPGRKYDCKEHIAEQVTDKESANYCDYFSPNRETAGGKDTRKKDDARNAFDKLFG